jgi:ABC-type transport system involved in multi-copper enzyme maturation permease subunit
MTRIVRAELRRLVRRRTVIVAAIGALLFSAVSALTVLASADENVVRSRQGGTTLAQVTGTGGGTEAFAVGASFAGFLVFVTFIALIASEFSGGTFRSLLLREPHRLRVILGKLAGILIVAAAIVALFAVCTFAMSLAFAPTQDIPTREWFSLASLGEGVGDYLTVMAGVTGWAIFGTTLAVIFRSAPIALGVGFAWAGPFENIVVDSWDTGFKVFPGQVLGSMIRGGTVELGLGRAIATAAIYTAIAGVVTLLLVSRRDVTA